MNQTELLTEQIEKKEHIRENLSMLRQELRAGDDEKRGGVLAVCLRPASVRLWEQCLLAEDAKARKNAALLLGDLAEHSPKTASWRADAVNALREAFSREETMFVRPFYLKALLAFAPEERADCLKQLQNRAEELEQMEADGFFTGENAKHLRQERRALEELLEQAASESGKSRSISEKGLEGTHRVLLTCEEAVAEKLKQQVQPLALTARRISLGVLAATDCLPRVLALPLYREAWFAVRMRKDRKADRQHLAEAVASSELLPILKRFYPGEETFSFRLHPVGMDAEKRRGDFLRKLADEMEAASGGRLRNRKGPCQARLMLLEKRDGTFGVFVKLEEQKDERFAYLKRRLPTSMSPVTAASMAALCAPYLKKDAQIIDPFCGVGTLLIERNRLMKAAYSYGTDIYGEAIAAGRENASAAGVEIYFINRNFFDFDSEYPFDEIISEPPRFTPGERAAAAECYRNFFAAANRILKPGGRMLFLSGEEGEIRKHLRLDASLRLLRQIPFRKEEKIYIIERS